MKTKFTVNAVLREDLGKGASRRLRKGDLVPGIVYGMGKDPAVVQVVGRDLNLLLSDNRVYTAVLEMELGDKRELVVLRDLQRHPYKPQILHFDLQRIDEKMNISMKVPLHFLGEESAPGVKIQGGVISKLLVDVTVSCLPRDLPEYIEVDLSKMEINQVIKLSDLALSEGVQLLNLMHGKEDSTVVTLYAFKENESADSAPVADETASQDNKDASSKK